MEYKGKYKDLVIPTINVNDTSVTISDIQKNQLEYIEEGEMLYSTETSKATEDYHVDFAGYVVLYVEELDEVEVGKSAGMIFELKEDAEACLAEVNVAKEKAKKLASVNASKKALAYAEQIGFDITLIKKDGIIKTEDIDNYINEHK
jgi:pyruvate/2-oxoglutarate dehydrogenase complex dihydrolipoamide acyltransferase (E2) component